MKRTNDSTRRSTSTSTKRANTPSAKKTSRRTLSDDDLKQVAGGTRASTKLAQACATGKHIAKAQIII